MKYIRTKNGIYEVKTKRIFNHIKEYKQADTIEELCDEFVVRDWFDKYCLEIDSNYEMLKKNGWLNGDYIIYGAIYTSKGLIYVAKMDSEGKLVLI